MNNLILILFLSFVNMTLKAEELCIISNTIPGSMNACPWFTNRIRIKTLDDLKQTLEAVKNSQQKLNSLWLVGHGSEKHWELDIIKNKKPKKNKIVAVQTQDIFSIASQEARGIIADWGKIKVRTCSAGRGCTGMINLYSYKQMLSGNGSIFGARDWYNPIYNGSKDGYTTMLQVRHGVEHWSYQGLFRDYETKLIDVCMDECSEAHPEVAKMLDLMKATKKRLSRRCNNIKHKLVRYLTHLKNCSQYKGSIYDESTSDIFYISNKSINHVLYDYTYYLEKQVQDCI